MAEQDYVVSKGLRLFRSAAQRKADEAAARLAIDRMIWPKEAAAADKMLARRTKAKARLAA